MSERSNALKRRHEEKSLEEQRSQREEAIKALRGLREIGERLPIVDAAAIVRENRELVEQDVR